MYERIKKHKPVRALYAEKLVNEGLLTKEEADEMAQKAYKRLADAHADLKHAIAEGHDDDDDEGLDRSASPEPKTTVSAETLRSLNEQLLRVPEGFEVHRKLKPQFERRRETLGEEGGIDWAQAEALAFSSLLVQGVPIRFTGQDVERGTFSHRHLVLHDAKTGDKHTPDPEPAERQRAVRAPQQPALGDGLRRLRVRLLARRRPRRSCSGRPSSATS